MTDTITIPFGPGFVGDRMWPNELSADVAVELTYAPQHEVDGGGTQASLVLYARDIEGTKSDVGVGVELTEGDLRTLRGTIEAILVAIKEDE